MALKETSESPSNESAMSPLSKTMKDDGKSIQSLSDRLDAIEAKIEMLDREDRARLPKIIYRTNYGNL